MELYESTHTEESGHVNSVDRSNLQTLMTNTRT